MTSLPKSSTDLGSPVTASSQQTSSFLVDSSSSSSTSDLNNKTSKQSFQEIQSATLTNSSQRKRLPPTSQNRKHFASSGSSLATSVSSTSPTLPVSSSSSPANGPSCSPGLSHHSQSPTLRVPAFHRLTASLRKRPRHNRALTSSVSSPSLTSGDKLNGSIEKWSSSGTRSTLSSDLLSNIQKSNGLRRKRRLSETITTVPVIRPVASSSSSDIVTVSSQLPDLLKNFEGLPIISSLKKYRSEAISSCVMPDVQSMTADSMSPKSTLPEQTGENSLNNSNTHSISDTEQSSSKIELSHTDGIIEQEMDQEQNQGDHHPLQSDTPIGLPDTGSPVASALLALEDLFAAAFGSALDNTVSSSFTSSSAIINRSHPRFKHSHSHSKSTTIKTTTESKNKSLSVSIPIHKEANSSNGLLPVTLSEDLSTGLESRTAARDFFTECFGKRFGLGGIRWSSRMAALESHNLSQQNNAVAELSEWLSYATEDTLTGFPLERAVVALLDILAGRVSSHTSRPSRLFNLNRDKKTRRKIKKIWTNSSQLTGSNDVEDPTDDELSNQWLTLPVTGTDLTAVYDAIEHNEEEEEEEDDNDNDNEDLHQEEEGITQDDISKHLVNDSSDDMPENTQDQLTSETTVILSESKESLKQPHELLNREHIIKTLIPTFYEHHNKNDADEEETSHIGPNICDTSIDHMSPEFEAEAVTRKISAANCLHLLLDIAPQTAEIIADEGDGLIILCNQLSQLAYIDLAERIVVVLQVLASEVPDRLLISGGIKALLEFLDFFALPIQRAVVTAVKSLLSHVETRDQYNEFVKENISQLAQLVSRDDESIVQTVCQCIRYLVNFITRDPEFASEALNDMASKGIAKSLFTIVTQAPGSNTFSLKTEPPLQSIMSHGYTFTFEALHILSSFAFYCDQAAIDLLSSGIFPILIGLLQHQGSFGTDEFLTVRILDLACSLVPSIHVYPSKNDIGNCSMIVYNTERMEIFLKHSTDITLILKYFLPLLLKPYTYPTTRNTVKLLLSFMLSLTTLLPVIYKKEDHPNLFDSINISALSSFLASTLSVIPILLSQEKDGIISCIQMHHFKDKQHSCQSLSVTTIFAAMSIILNLLNYQPTIFAAPFIRYGLIDTIQHYCGLSDSMESFISNVCSHSTQFTICNEVLETQGNDLFTSLSRQCSTFSINSDYHQPIVLVNMTALLKWSSIQIILRIRNELVSNTTVSKSLSLKQQQQEDKKGCITQNPYNYTLSTLKYIANGLRQATSESFAQDSHLFQSLKDILMMGHGSKQFIDISPFECLSSGIISALSYYLFGHIVDPLLTYSPDSCLTTSLLPESPINPTLLQDRLLLFIKTLGQTIIDQTTQLSNDDTVWEETGMFSIPIDTRCFLLFIRLCIRCISHKDILPLHLFTEMQQRKLITTQEDQQDSKMYNGCLVAHFSPLRMTSSSLFQIVIKQLCAIHPTIQIQPSTQHDNLLIISQESNHFQDVCCIAQSLTDAQDTFKPQLLFDNLSRDIKLNARVTVGSTIECHLSFPGDQLSTMSHEETVRQDTELHTNVSKLKTQIRVDSNTDRCLVAFSILDISNLIVESPLITGTSDRNDTSKVHTIPSLRLLLQLSLDGRATAGMLQHSLSELVEKQIRLMHRSQRSHINGTNQSSPNHINNNAINIPEELESKDLLNTEDDKTNTNMTEKPLESRVLYDTNSISSLSGTQHQLTTTTKSTKQLFVMINGNIVPPHLPLFEALCRYSNVLMISKPPTQRLSRFGTEASHSTQTQPHSASKEFTANQQEPMTSLSVESNTLICHDKMNTLLQSLIKTDAIMKPTTVVDHTADSSISFSGIWLALKKDFRFIICSHTEERNCCIQLSRFEFGSCISNTTLSTSNDRRSITELTDQTVPRQHTVPSTTSNDLHPDQTSEHPIPVVPIISHHQSHRKLRYQPLWGVDHLIDANLSDDIPVPESLDSRSETYRSLEHYYIKDPISTTIASSSSFVSDIIYVTRDIFDSHIHQNIHESDNKQDIPLNNVTHHDIGKKFGSLQLLPLPELSQNIDHLIQLLPDGTRYLSLGQVLAYFDLKHTCQSLGLTHINFDHPMILFKVNNNTRLSTEHTKKMDSAMMSTLDLTMKQSTVSFIDQFLSLAKVMKLFDLNPQTSPIICNTMSMEFSHLAIYCSFVKYIQRIIRATLPISTIHTSSYPSLTDSCCHQETSYVLNKPTTYHVPVVISRVHSQMQYLHGLRSGWIRNDPIFEAGFFTHTHKKKNNLLLGHTTCESPVVFPKDNTLTLHPNPSPLNAVDDSLIHQEVDDDEHDFVDLDDEDDEDEEDDDDVEEEEDTDNEDIDHDERELFELHDTHIYWDKQTDILDILDNNHEFSTMIRIILLLLQVIRRSITSNMTLHFMKPTDFLLDSTNSHHCLFPLYFPTSCQLKSACVSSVLTSRARRQLADPIAIASGRLPNWLFGLASVAPELFPLQIRKILHMSTTNGTLRGLAVFKDRLRRTAESLGTIQHSSSNTSSFLRNMSSIMPIKDSSLHDSIDDPLWDKGRCVPDECDIENDLETDVFTTDSALVFAANTILGCDGGNKRKQMEKLSDLDQALAPQRTKIRLLRHQVLTSATKVFDYFHMSGTSSILPLIMEVEYFGEEGVGSGPTLEFYSEVIDKLIDLSQPILFRTDRPNGFLFPAPYHLNPLSVSPVLLRRPNSGKWGSQSPMVSGDSQSFLNEPIICPTSASSITNLRESHMIDNPNDSSLAGHISDLSQSDVSTIMSFQTTSQSLEDSLFSLFKLLGQLYAKALLDHRLIDIPLHPLFWEFVITPTSEWNQIITNTSLRYVDPSLYKHLMSLKKIEDDLENLEIYFILPGSAPEIELIPNGKTILVTKENLDLFIQSITQWTCYTGIALQAWAFRFGISTLLPISSLCIFSPNELSFSVTGSVSAIDQNAFWTLEHLSKAITPDHGYTNSSVPFQQFLEVITELTRSQRRLFLKFCTGTTVLPAGGFIALQPPMRVVKKEVVSTTSSSSSSSTMPSRISTIDEVLPSVMACSNYVKLPAYSSKNVLREKLLFALEEGQDSTKEKEETTLEPSNAPVSLLTNNIFHTRRQFLKGNVQLDQSYQNHVTYNALQHIIPDERIRIICSIRQLKSIQNLDTERFEEINNYNIFNNNNNNNDSSYRRAHTVSLDIETEQNRFWLAAFSDAEIAIFDYHQSYKEYAHFKNSLNNNALFPLGYIPTEEEIQNKKGKKRINIVPKILTHLSQKNTHVFNDHQIDTQRQTCPSSIRPKNLLTCCKWIPGETGGIISSYINGEVSIWDIEYSIQSNASTISKTYKKPLFSLKAPNTTIRYFTSNGEYTSHAMMNTMKSTPWDRTQPIQHRLIMCCCGDPKAPLRTLDLRIGAFVNLFGGVGSVHLSGSSVSFPRIIPTSACWNPRNSNLFISGSLNGQIQCWDIRKPGSEFVFSFNRNKHDPTYVSQQQQPQQPRPQLNSASSQSSEEMITNPRLDQLKHALSQLSCNSNEFNRHVSSNKRQFPNYSLNSNLKKPSNPTNLKYDSTLHYNTGFASTDALWSFVRNNSLQSINTRCEQINSFKTKETIKQLPSTVPKKIKSYPTITRSQDHFEGHNFPITGLNFVFNGTHIISSSLGNNTLTQTSSSGHHLYLWNAGTGEFCPLYFPVSDSMLPNVPTLSESRSRYLRNHVANEHIKNSFSYPQGTRSEVFTIGSHEELFCCGFGTGIAVYNIVSGKLIHYSKSSILDNIVSVISPGDLSGISDNFSTMITAYTQKELISWNF